MSHGLSYCPDCGSPVASSDRFCGKCGGKLVTSVFDAPRYIGTRISRGWYRVTFKPVEVEVGNDEYAADAAIEVGPKVANVELVRLTSTPELYPLVCSSCHAIVASEEDVSSGGACCDCGDTTWIRRVV